MGLADSVSRLTCLLALMGQIAILLSLPALLVGAAEVYWPGLLLLAASPQLALLAQLGSACLACVSSTLTALRRN